MHMETHVLVKKYFINGYFPLFSNDSQWSGKTVTSWERKNSGRAVTKESHAENMGHQKTNHY